MLEMQQSEYPKHAEHAAVLEREGFYSDAAFAWTVAAQNARQPANRAWADHRASFCHVWSRHYQQGVAR